MLKNIFLCMILTLYSFYSYSVLEEKNLKQFFITFYSLFTLGNKITDTVVDISDRCKNIELEYLCNLEKEQIIDQINNRILPNHILAVQKDEDYCDIKKENMIAKIKKSAGYLIKTI